MICQTCQYVCITTFYVCMILTKQIAEIQRFISEQGAFPFVIVLGVAVGSLETCSHVIPMPESHNLALVLMGICTLFILACTT